MIFCIQMFLVWFGIWVKALWVKADEELRQNPTSAVFLILNFFFVYQQIKTLNVSFASICVLQGKSTSKESFVKRRNVGCVDVVWGSPIHCC